MSRSRPKFSSTRAEHIKPFYVMDLLARARQLEAEGRSVIHLEVGEPDMPTATPIIDAGIRALEAEQTHYTSAVGLTALREAISRYYAQRYAIDVSPGRIVITPGASGGLQLVLAALLDAGDEVLLSDPGYPCNRNIAEILGITPRAVPVDASTAYQLHADMIAEHWRAKTRVAMVASPSNPTGSVIPRTQLSGLYDAISERGGTLIVDEIYQGIQYGTEDETALSLADDIIVVNSFSKYFGMTGWRLGWLVLPERLVECVDRMAQNLFLAAPTMSQHAALAAFSDECRSIFDERVEEFRQRHDYLSRALREIGFVIAHPPEGAFYLYADCSSITTDSFSWVQTLLEAEGVAVTPGIDFGEHRAHEHVRFAYTRPVDQLEIAVERIIRHLN